MRGAVDVRGSDRASVDRGGARASAFERLADQHLDSAYRLARAILHHPVEAEDATHDAIVQAWRKWPTLKDESRFEAWFARILVNVCRDRLRRAARRPTQGLGRAAALASVDEFRLSDDREVIRSAVARLSPDHQIVVALRYFADLPIEDIGRRLGIPAGTVQSRLHYALARLSAALDWMENSGATR